MTLSPELILLAQAAVGAAVTIYGFYGVLCLYDNVKAYLWRRKQPKRYEYYVRCVGFDDWMPCRASFYDQAKKYSLLYETQLKSK